MKAEKIALILMLALGLGALTVLPAEAGDMRLTFDAAGLFSTRSAGATTPLVSLSANPGTGNIMTTDDVALTAFKFGGNAGLGVSWGALGFEIRGFLVGRATNSSTYTAPSSKGLLIETNPQTTYGLPRAGSTLTGTYESALFGVEANLTYDLSPAVRLYGGARYLSLKETFNFQGYFNPDGEDDLWDTRNAMWGGQAGLRFAFGPGSAEAGTGFVVEGHGAFLLLSNSVSVDFSTSWDPAGAAEGSKLCPGMDAGLRFGFRLSPAAEIFAGYSMLWLGGAATAVAQIGGTSSFNHIGVVLTPAFGSLLVHGAQAGLRLHL